jgi:hypothetical protein
LRFHKKSSGFISFDVTEHESLGAAANYLKEIGYSDVYHRAVSRAIENDVARYDRTWKFL